MEKSDIRLVISSLTPEPVDYFGKTGGIVRLVEILKRFQSKSRVKIFIISTSYGRRCLEEKGIFAKFKIVKSRLRFKSLLGLCLKSLFIIAKMLLVLNPNFLESKNEKVVVYSSSDLFWEVIPAFYLKKKNKHMEWIQVIHHIYPDWKKRAGNKLNNFFGYYFQKFSFWLIRKKADKIIVLNSRVKNDLSKMGFSQDRIFISSNGIDFDYFEGLKKDEKAYDGVFLGRLSPSKGLADLIKIWKNVCQELPEARLAIIGGGSEETKNFLQNKISNFKLKENIDLLGFLEDEKTYPILKAGKVFLFPSHEEGWGIAVAEAMACSLPVVSWNLPAYKEVFEDYTLQIEENNIDLFSKKVIELLKNDSLCQTIGESGKNFIRKYSWNSVAERELKIINR